MSPLRIAVIGGGISGFAAAHRLRTLLGPEAVVTVFEQRDRIGGVLRTVDLAGVPFDVGAEAFLARRPEIPALLRELGLAERQVRPTGATSSLRAGGRSLPMPGATVLGVPTSAARLDALLSPAGLAAVGAEPERPLAWEAGGDVPLGALLRSRFGDELPDRLTDPLLGGVYAGRVDSLGLRATIPAIAAALDAGASSLTAAADRAAAPPATPPPAELRTSTRRVARSDTASRASRPGESRVLAQAAPAPGDDPAPPPVFGALRGGFHELLDALRVASGAEVRLRTTVRALERTAGGWRLVTGPTTAPETVDVDAVVLAVPAPAAARLLGGVAAGSARAAGEIELASSAVVAMAFRAADAASLPPTSGALVASGEPLSVKAFTHSTTKWAHLSPDGLVRLRASLGRFGQAAALQVDDARLVELTCADLATLTGITAAPVAVHVQRWGGGLPQYGVGHLDRVRTVEDGLPQGVAVAGSAMHGVGVPACVGTARAAAQRVASQLVGARVG